MSIDRMMDAFHEQQGTRPLAEVVPEHACQIFDDTPGAPGPAAPADDAEERLAAAREAVEALLGPMSGTESGDNGETPAP